VGTHREPWHRTGAGTFSKCPALSEPRAYFRARLTRGSTFVNTNFTIVKHSMDWIAREILEENQVPALQRVMQYFAVLWGETPFTFVYRKCNIRFIFSLTIVKFFR
jgi:hypothetical protein